MGEKKRRRKLTGKIISVLREIGYEIVDQVVDFSGQNHTVINFKNAYQFIPSGRCVYVYNYILSSNNRKTKRD